MEITGIVKKVFDTQQVSDKFSKRDVVVTTPGEYPQDILIQATQSRCVMFDNLPVGSNVKCQINLRGKEYNSPTGETKYFNTLECWKIDVI